MTPFDERLRALAPGTLAGIRRGIEKEGLRVGPDGSLARTPHPAGLGSALTHEHITTDFSESQLELITGVHGEIDACLRELTEIHQVVYRALGDELLWASSMPCRLPADELIPIGRYGSSNVGRAKTVYRNGLSHRYGRRMQTISGIHYNFSLPETAWPELQRADAREGPAAAYRNDAYFGLIRNFRRHSWLLLYLLGASPAVCGSFVAGREHELQPLAEGTLHMPWGTSLRMGPLGYQSDAQASLAVSFNSLRSYAASLNPALTRPYPPYEAIGMRDGDEYRQLSTSLLQIENEFYGTIRPKQPIRPGERPLHALGERGVAYVEVRLVDIDPFLAVGIDARAMRLLDLFLLHCLLSDSPPDTADEIANISRNQHRVAAYGREPGLQLCRDGAQRPLADWGLELVDAFAPIAAALDAAQRGEIYRAVLSQAAAALRDASSTPSARVLRAMREDFGDSYVAFAAAQSQRHRDALLRAALAPETERRYALMAAESLAEQRRIEAADRIPFETYRRQYIAQDLVGGAQLRSA
ncbi:MAG TPA: glutamate--cysteine ligase [Burkholderiales bacterium]|nr:glutamate--cysteine ligase [Burkholderiales bacterium]